MALDYLESTIKDYGISEMGYTKSSINGTTLENKNGKLYVNGRLLNDEYLIPPPSRFVWFSIGLILGLSTPYILYHLSTIL